MLPVIPVSIPLIVLLSKAPNVKPFIFFAFCSLTIIHTLQAANVQPRPVQTSATAPVSPFMRIEKKLTPKEKAVLWLLQKKRIKNYIDGKATPEQKSMARLSMIMGLASVALWLSRIWLLPLLGFTAAIAAVILGIKSLEGNKNPAGIVGVAAGGATLLIILLSIIAVL